MRTVLLSIIRNGINVLGAATMALGYFGDILQLRIPPHVLIAAGNIALLVGILWTIRAQRDERGRAEGVLTGRIKDLEDRLAPKLGILYEPVAPFVQFDVIEGTVMGRLFRVGVKNLGGQTIDNVQVRLETLLDMDQSPPRQGAYATVSLQEMNDDSPDGVPYQQTFTLNPQQVRYFNVASKPEDINVQVRLETLLDKDQSPPKTFTLNQQIWLRYADRCKSSFIACRRHELHIVATGRDVSAEDRWFFVDVDTHNRLIFGPKETPYEAPVQT